MHIRKAIEDQANSLISNWLYLGWEIRSGSDEIESSGDDGTCICDLSGNERIELAEEWFKETNTLESAVAKDGLGLAIWYAASASVIAMSEELARSFATSLEEAVLSFAKLYPDCSLRAVERSDPLGYFPPKGVKNLANAWAYEYRQIEGDLNSDVIEFTAAAQGDYESKLEITFYLRLDFPIKRVA